MLQKGVTDEEVKTILEKKHALFNAMGIMQHHDAITGTAKQAVADTYSQLLTDAVATNNDLLVQMVGERASAAGYGSLDWNACTFTSTTPVDCGLSSSAGQSFMISAYNPSTVNLNYLRFSVPNNGTYKAYALQVDQTWQEVPSDMLCYTATSDEKQASTFDECELFVKASTVAHSTTYVKIETVATNSGKV